MRDELKDSEKKPPAGEEMTGVILAGGKSSRFRRNKALEKLDGIRLIERVVFTLDALFGRLILITNAPEDFAYLKLPMYQDIIKGLGPLGGIYTGLQAMKDWAGFFVACDMPFLNADFIRYMSDFRDHFQVVVPKIGWRLQTLHAVYTKDCLSPIKTLIEKGDRQIFRFFHEMRVKYILEEVIRTYDPELRSFLNINKQEELVRAEKGHPSSNPM